MGREAREPSDIHKHSSEFHSEKLDSEFHSENSEETHRAEVANVDSNVPLRCPRSGRTYQRERERVVRDEIGCGVWRERREGVVREEEGV